MTDTDRLWDKFLNEIADEYDPIIVEIKWKEFKYANRMKKFLKVGEYNTGGSNDQS